MSQQHVAEQRTRGKSWLHLLLVTLFGLPLITPLLRWSSVPCTHDGHLHYHRVVAIKHAWQNGMLFSRWLPDLAFGYGYPFFLYREPLPLYLTHFLHLAGLPLPAATNLFYILCLLAAGWFTFFWLRDIFGSAAGLVSAVAYMAAPYQLADVLVRGNQVESMAMALFPLLLWSGRRFVLNGRTRWFLLSTLGLAALALSHNISLLLFTPTLGLYLLALALLQRLSWQQTMRRLSLIFIVGLGLTAFYTGPALLEMDEVTLSLSTTTRNNDFRYNFASPGEIFGPVTPEDPTLINPPLPFRLGWVPTALALLGLLSLARNRDREQRAHILLMAAATLVFLFFTLPLSRILWEGLPLIEFVQFPWRFVGRAALPVAVLGGAPFALLTNWRRSIDLRYLLPATGVAIVLLLFEAFPLLYPNYCLEEPYPTILAAHEYEHETGLVGVDPEGSYFPTTVEQRPDGSPLEADYEAGRTPQRFDRSVLPEEASLLQESYEPNEARLVIETPVAFEARYLTLAFPGWQVQIDGEEVPLTPSDPLGLITFSVPAGQHTIEVDWTTTPLRTAFGVLSIAAALVLVGATFWLRRESSESNAVEPATAAPANRSIPYPAALLVLALLLIGAKVLVDRVETPLRRASTPPVEQASDLHAAELRLMGFNLSREAVPSGATFDVDLAWQTEAVPATAYQSNLWLRGPQGLVWSDTDTFRTRLYEDAPPTEAWLPGHWAWDSREVQVLPGTPPGHYELVLTVFRLDNLEPLTLLENATAVGPTTVIAQVEVTPPQSPAEFEPQVTVEQTIGGLRLMGYNQDRAQAAPGDPLLLTLFWEKATSEREAASELPLVLLSEAGEPIHEWQIAPVRQGFPPMEWQEGQGWRGQHLLRLPAALESGTYRLQLGGTVLGQIEIEAPERLFQKPSTAQTVEAEFGGVAQLTGYSIDPPDALHDATPGPMTVTLAWRGLAEMEVSYSVFVHLHDAQGQTVAQSDAEPAQWARPTTGWAPGEYVTDRHVLQVPEGVEGPLALRVGLYEAGSGQRLPVNGTDHILLP